MNISDIFYVVSIVYMVFTMVFLLVILFVCYRFLKYLQKLKKALSDKSKLLDVLRYSFQFELLQKLLQFLNKLKGGDKK